MIFGGFVLKKQTRRAVSISGELYEALHARAIQDGCGASTIVERELRSFLGLAPGRTGKSGVRKDTDSTPPPRGDVLRTSSVPRAIPQKSSGDMPVRPDRATKKDPERIFTF